MKYILHTFIHTYIQTHTHTHTHTETDTQTDRHVHFLYSQKKPKKLWFSGIFRGHKMRTLTRNVLKDVCYLSLREKYPLFGVFPVRISPHSDWIRRDTPYLSVFRPNAGKYGPEKLRIQTFFTQCILLPKLAELSLPWRGVIAYYQRGVCVPRPSALGPRLLSSALISSTLGPQNNTIILFNCEIVVTLKL